MKKIILAIVIIAIIIAIIAGIVILTTQNKEEKNLSNKTETQIAYLEEKVITMLNHINQIHFSNSILVEKNTDENSQNSQGNNDSSNTNNGSGNTESSNGSKGSNGSEQGESGSQGSSQESQGSSGEKKQSSSPEDNIEYSIKNNSILNKNNQEIDWEYIKTNTEIIYSTWPSMVVDLHELNVRNEDILNFSTTLDQVTLGAKQEDKAVTLNNLASLYALLPNYRSQISDNSQEINIDYTKACLVNSYAFVEQDNWEEVKSQIQQAIGYFTNIMNSIDGNGQKQSHVSKIYVSLNELNTTIDNQDKDLYYIQYRNVMEELMKF